MNKLSIKFFAKFALCGLAAVMLASPLKISAEEAQSLSGNTPGQATEEKNPAKPALDDLNIKIYSNLIDGVWQLPIGQGVSAGVFSNMSLSSDYELLKYYTAEWTYSDGIEITKSNDVFVNITAKKMGNETISVKVTDNDDATKTKVFDIKVNVVRRDSNISNTSDALKTEDILANINGEIKSLYIGIDPEKTTNISKDVFKAAKEAGVDLIIQTILEGQNVGFTFKAADITNTDIDLDLSVLVNAKNDAVTSIIPSEAAPLIVDFAHNGNLPGKANVTITILNEEMYNTYKDSKELNVYHINKATGNLEKIENATIEGATINFTITHCSQYVLTKTELVEGQTKFADVKKDELDAQPNTGV